MTFFCTMPSWVLITPQKPTGLCWLVFLRLLYIIMCITNIQNCQNIVLELSTPNNNAPGPIVRSTKQKYTESFQVHTTNFILHLYKILPSCMHITKLYLYKCTSFCRELVNACHIAIHKKEFNWIGWIHYGANVHKHCLHHVVQCEV